MAPSSVPPTTGRDGLLEELRAAVGAANVLVDADTRASYETDWTRRYHGEALAVVRPASTEEVAGVVRTCAQHGVAIVPQGGKTGLVGGSVPRGGEVVLTLGRMHAIETLDTEAGEMIVGAGTTLGAVQEAARPHGWDLGVDVGSRGSATVGGMLATNAGGEHVLRHGPMADQVLGVEAVLGDGTVVGRLPALRKDNTGYRWHHVLAGSEGTLGIVTRVHLRLVRVPHGRATALVGLADLPAALALAAALRRDVDGLDALEAFFADGLTLVREHTGLPDPLARPAPVYLLAEAGDDDAERAVAALGATVAEAARVVDAAVATDGAGRARLWRYREAHTEAIGAAGVPHKLDVTLPRGALAAFPDAVRARIAAVDPGARPFLFGHVGDGNIHVNVLGPAADDDRVDDAVLGLVVELGGSISAEHGIGVAKRAWLARTRSPAELDAMRALKHALDPSGILNPGVILT